MANKSSPLLPATAELLAALGERLRLARERRKLTAAQVAARAGMAPLTLRNIERGADGVTIGAYLAVMQVLWRCWPQATTSVVSCRTPP